MERRRRGGGIREGGRRGGAPVEGGRGRGGAPVEGGRGGGGGGGRGEMGTDDGASSSLSREQKQEAQEEAMEKAVQAALKKVNPPKEGDAFQRKVELALMDASMRAMLDLKNQTSIEKLPKFQIDMKCTPKEMEDFFEDIRFRYQLVASFNIYKGIVVTPTDKHVLYHLIEVMETLEDAEGTLTQISVMQFVFKENDHYMSAYRPTPKGVGNEYRPGGFFVFEGVKIPKLFGTIYRMGHPESYTCPTQVEVRPGFLELMVRRLLANITVQNYRCLITDRIPFLEAPMIFFGEFQRSGEVRECARTEDAPFGLLTGPLDVSEYAAVSHVTDEMVQLFQNWSALSKVGLHFYIAIIELEKCPIEDALISFIKARMELRRCVHKMASDAVSVNLELYNPDGIFSLKKLLGKYILLAKYEKDLVVRSIMRGRRNFQSIYDRFKENERIQSMWDRCGTEEFNPDAPDTQRPYYSDKVEWDRWLEIKERVRVDLLNEFMESEAAEGG